jgi:hypothetical protein
MQRDRENALIAYEKAQALGDKSPELTARITNLKEMKS